MIWRGPSTVVENLEIPAGMPNPQKLFTLVPEVDLFIGWVCQWVDGWLLGCLVRWVDGLLGGWMEKNEVCVVITSTVVRIWLYLL